MQFLLIVTVAASLAPRQHRSFLGKKSAPNPDDVWAQVSGDDNVVTEDEMYAGVAAYFPEMNDEQKQAMADCMMREYDTSGDDLITRDEFDAAFGKHYEDCKAYTMHYHGMMETAAQKQTVRR